MEKLLAPVIIPTLNRYDHLKRCIESLERCTGVEYTKLYVGLDYPPSAKYEEGWKKVHQYLQYKCKNNKFNEIVILERDTNLGAVKNIEELETYISQKYVRFIFTEDDNEFSPNFLDFINQGLERYKDDQNVYAICGYNYPIDMSGYNKNYYFSHEYSAWGFGCWSEKFITVNRFLSQDNYLASFCRQQPISAFTRNNCRLLPFVRYINKGFLGDVCITTFLQSNNYFCVFPKVSMVRNWGHDGSGVNCGEMAPKASKIFEQQEIQCSKTFEFGNSLEKIVPESVNIELQKFFSSPFKTNAKSLFLLIILKLKFWK